MLNGGGSTSYPTPPPPSWKTKESSYLELRIAQNISAKPPIYVLFSKYEDSFVFLG